MEVDIDSAGWKERRGRIELESEFETENVAARKKYSSVLFGEMQSGRFDGRGRFRRRWRYEDGVVAVDFGRRDCDVSRCQFRAGVDDENEEATDD